MPQSNPRGEFPSFFFFFLLSFSHGDPTIVAISGVSIQAITYKRTENPLLLFLSVIYGIADLKLKR